MPPAPNSSGHDTSSASGNADQSRVPVMFRDSATMARRRGVGVALCMLFSASAVMAAVAATTSIQAQAPKTFAVPSVGDPIQQSISRGALHEWPLDLASGEFLHLTIDPSDIDVAAPVVAPDG